MTLFSHSAVPNLAMPEISAGGSVVVLGIDPGLNGALAFIHSDKGILDIIDMPTLQIVRNGKFKREVDPAGVASAILLYNPTRAVLELVNATPQMGVTSSFSFGESKGIVRGVLAALNVPMTSVPPLTWQRAMHVRKGKDAARARAAELFPRDATRFRRVKDDGRADATLIAAYGLSH